MGINWDDITSQLRNLQLDSTGNQIERYEHLIDQLVLWFSWETLHADASRPFFHRQNDLVSQWGGPNADNVYRHARVSSTHSYVIRGRMHSCEDFVLAIRSGFMHQETWGTLQLFVASDHGIHPGDDFEIFLGGPNGDVPLPEEAVMVSIREYYFDWKAEEPSTFTIECLDPQEPPVIKENDLNKRLEKSLGQIEDSLTFWDTYLESNRNFQEDNCFSEQTVKVGKGLSLARYEFCFWNLDPTEALVVEADVPLAKYWGIQLYNLGTFELIDPYGRISSRNHNQTIVSNDGKIRFVISGQDPGVANWLDTANNSEGLCTFRWFWPESDKPFDLTTHVVSIADLDSVLPEDASQCSLDERKLELRNRQEHLRWRFRT